MNRLSRAWEATGEFGRAFLITLVPIVIVSIVGGVVTAWLWIVAYGFVIIAAVAAIILRVKGNKKIASGIVAGIGIGTIAAFASCFAALGRTI